MSALARTALSEDAVTVAPRLLGSLLVHETEAGTVGVRIVEVEAYEGDADPGSHAFRGKTARNAVMFAEAGLAYVYFTYGMHWCANTVCGDEGEGWGVLLRALEPLTGIDRMRVSRPRARKDTDLCSGPARLTQALSITGANDGADLVLGDQGFRVLADDSPAPTAVVASPRIGISRATEQPWRWYLAGNPHVSRK